MKQLSSIDLYFLVKEFEILKNRRIDDFYYNNETFYIKIYISGVGNKFLTNKRAKYIYLGDKKVNSPQPYSFLRYLRKTLKNGYIRNIEQVNGERILKIEIEKMIGEELKKFYLILELFANGNTIICDEDMVIREATSKRKFKDRKIMVHDEYQLPPAKDITIVNFDKKIFAFMIKESDLVIVKFLAIKLGLGGKFAEEICVLSSIDKNKKTQELDDNEFKLLIKKIEALKNKEIKACAVMKDREILDFFPFDFKSIENEKKEFKSFNEVVMKYFEQFKDEDDQREQALAKELAKLENRLKKQKQQLEKVEKDYEKYNELGNKIYENYAIIEELLQSINIAAKEKGWEHVKNTIKENPKLSKLIKTLNYKNNEIILDL